MPYANTSAATSRGSAPHGKNAARRNRSDSPYQQRTTQRDNPTQLLIKQAVDYLIQPLEAGNSTGHLFHPPIPPEKLHLVSTKVTDSDSGKWLTIFLVEIQIGAKPVT